MNTKRFQIIQWVSYILVTLKVWKLVLNVRQRLMPLLKFTQTNEHAMVLLKKSTRMKTRKIIKNFNVDYTYRISLLCLVDEKGEIIEVYDHKGNKLIHNKEARTVFHNGKFLFY